MSFLIRDNGSLPLVNEWSEVRFIEHAATRPVLFGGFVQSARIATWAVAGRDIAVECVGYGILLDRKVVPAYDVDADFVGDHVVSLVNRHGGRVGALADRPTAVSGGSGTGRNTYTSSPTYSVANPWDWWWSVPPAGGRPDITSPVLLRGVLDAWSEMSSDEAYSYVAGLPTTDPWPSVGMTYWVDECALLHAHPRLVESLAAANSAYDGDAPVAISEATGAGLVRAETWQYERENTDLLTSAYVIGGNANGTGYVRREGHERAGDLETLVTQSESTSTTLKQGYGDGAIAGTQAVDARSTVSFTSDAPVDIRPGQKLTVSSTPLSLSSASFRISGVSIRFTTSTIRTYTVAFGGPLQVPSAMRRSGRFRSRR